MRTAFTFHSIFVRVMGMVRRIERKVSELMLEYMSSRPLCSAASWAWTWVEDREGNSQAQNSQG